MTLASITYMPIGLIRSSHVRPDQTPIQPVFANGWQDGLDEADVQARGRRQARQTTPSPESPT